MQIFIIKKQKLGDPPPTDLCHRQQQPVSSGALKNVHDSDFEKLFCSPWQHILYSFLLLCTFLHLFKYAITVSFWVSFSDSIYLAIRVREQVESFTTATKDGKVNDRWKSFLEHNEGGQNGVGLSVSLFSHSRRGSLLTFLLPSGRHNQQIRLTWGWLNGTRFPESPPLHVSSAAKLNHALPQASIITHQKTLCWYIIWQPEYCFL